MKRVRRRSPKLPHERDESPAAPAAPTPEMDRARRDVAEGQVDTDSYTRTRGNFEHTPGRGRG
ncbi:MAG: hypothetical protein ABI881_02405 [Betaproteobacteria bacterium]